MKYRVTLNGKIYEVEVEETEAVITDIMDAPAPSAPAAPAPAPTGTAAPAAAEAASPPAGEVNGTKIIAPMPGAILAVNVSQGQAVKAGDILLVLEAMKMENEMVSPVDGTVAQVLVRKGDVVDTDTVMVVIG